MPILLLIIALVSILTTVGIVITLLAETIKFFQKNSHLWIFLPAQF